jgi:RNA polymerase sigma-70 factor, ECF subfamily
VVVEDDNRMSDEALLSAVASGEREALRKLAQRYGHALSAVAQRILLDKTDAEEVAADVVWQAWRDASRFDRSRGSVGSWLMMLVRSRAIDRLRARKVRERKDQDSREPPLSDDPSNEIHRAERRRTVELALAGLIEAEREVLRLAYFSDLSQSEIAERTGLPLGTVKSRMRSGLVKLRDVLEGRIG